MELSDIDIKVRHGSVAEIGCDMLALKYAQAFHGADQFIAERMQLSAGRISPLPGEYTIIQGNKSISAKNVIFIGVPPLRSFSYMAIMEFAAKVLKILAVDAPDVEHLAMTMHGVNFGLDERESFRAQIAGIELALRENKFPKSLRKITIMEWNDRRAERLAKLLNSYMSAHTTTAASNAKIAPAEPTSAQITSSVSQSAAKPHIFVAMPFSDEMEDVYTFGIQGPVNDAGFLCERVDMATFTGDILERIKTRIATATLVIADMSGANANVYLEVGYAWGTNRPTLLVLRKGENLKFDVIGQRCIFYKTISELKTKLEADLRHITAKAT